MVVLAQVQRWAGYNRSVGIGDLSAGLRQLKPSLDEAGEDHDVLNSRE